MSTETQRVEHTPGPWTSENWSITGREAADSMRARSGIYGSILGVEYEPRHEIIAQLNGKRCVGLAFGVDLAHAKANARMMAAAPKLFDALAYAIDNPDFDSEKFDIMARAALGGAK